MAKLILVDPASFAAMELDAHLLYFTKLSGKSLDFYFLMGSTLTGVVLACSYVKLSPVMWPWNPSVDSMAVGSSMRRTLQLRSPSFQLHKIRFIGIFPGQQMCTILVISLSAPLGLGGQYRPRIILCIYGHHNSASIGRCITYHVCLNFHCKL